MIDRPEARRLFHYAFPLLLIGLVVSPVSWLVLTMLQQSSGFNAVGLYTVASSLAASLLLIPTAITTPMVPLISEMEVIDKGRVQSFSSKILHMTFVFFLPVTMLLALFAPLALRILYGEGYIAAWRVLYLLSIGTFLMALDNVIVCVFMGTGRMWASFGLNVIWMISLIVTTVLLVPPLAAVGLGIAYLISYAVYTGAVLAYARLRVGIVLHDMEVILLIAAFAFGLSVVPSFVAEGLLHYAICFIALAVITAAVVVMLRDYEWSFIRSLLRRVSR
jgi:PST family polysaccharide transporter